MIAIMLFVVMAAGSSCLAAPAVELQSPIQIMWQVNEIEKNLEKHVANVSIVGSIGFEVLTEVLKNPVNETRVAQLGRQLQPWFRIVANFGCGSRGRHVQHWIQDSSFKSDHLKSSLQLLQSSLAQLDRFMWQIAELELKTQADAQSAKTQADLDMVLLSSAIDFTKSLSTLRGSLKDFKAAAAAFRVFVNDEW